MSESQPQLLTARQLAAYLGVHINTVKRLVRDGELPHYRVGPNILRFTREDVDTWLASQRREASDGQ